MRPKAPHFEIDERQDGGSMRLQLTGELDLVSVPLLEHRLEQLHAERRPVLLDLAKLEFMDSTGIHLPINEFNHARADGWQFAVDPYLAPQVQHLFKLTDVERFTGADGLNGH